MAIQPLQRSLLTSLRCQDDRAGYIVWTSSSKDQETNSPTSAARKEPEMSKKPTKVQKFWSVQLTS